MLNCVTSCWKLIDFEPKKLIGNVVLWEQPSGKTELGVKSAYCESLDILSMSTVRLLLVVVHCGLVYHFILKQVVS